jgi:glycosyltransferase involved in cell wall biosynthesis
LVVYDLIPLISPEFCVVTEGFANYTKLFRIADQAICISKSVQKDLENFIKVSLREIPAPIDNRFLYLGANFIEGGPSLKTQAEEIQSEKTILVVGTFEPRKNQIGILRAAKILFERGLKFRIIFAGNPGWKNDEFLIELDRIDPERRFVRIETGVSDSRLAELYRSCAFTIFFSVIEGFGLPIIESLALGKPVIVSNRGSMAELAAECGGCHLVAPEQMSELAKAMEFLLTSEEGYRDLKASIRQLPNLTWDHYTQELVRMSVTLLSSSPVNTQG